MDNRRKTDKVKLIYGIAFGIIQIFVLWILVPMESRIVKRVDSIENIIQQEIDKSTQRYIELKQDISKIRQDYPRDIRIAIDKVMDRITAIFDRQDRDKL